MTSSIDTHDDVALRDEEIIAFWAMAHNADDDEVECDREGCNSEARWRWRCPCGEWRDCDYHRIDIDRVNQSSQYGRGSICGECRTRIPYPIPWLPM